jgi:polyphosphate kinase
MIRREIQVAQKGKPAHLVFKMNALTDIEMIWDLYEASKAGVMIDLIIRGICCLRPGAKGVSENIRVISIVGRFLEHSRVFYFANDGHPELYLSSADLMDRNLDRRVELMFPIEDPYLAEFIKREVLDDALRDNTHARFLNPEGMYVHITPQNGDQVFDSQAATVQSRLKQQKSTRAVLREAP